MRSMVGFSYPDGLTDRGRARVQAMAKLLPDLQALIVGLTSVLRSYGFTTDEVVILNRQPNSDFASFPSEIVTCRADDGSELTLFCKYEAGYSHNAYGHRGGVAYEAMVYHHLLQSLQAPTPTFYGTYTDISTGDTWLILEYLYKSSKSNRVDKGINLAARWIGQFHKASEDRLSHVSLPFLKRYDAEYYLGWIRRTLLFADHLGQRFPWLGSLCERFEEFVTPLLARSPTLIHGEYYLRNVLYRGGTMYPIDWESAAIATGEIDLAALTAGGPRKSGRVREWPAEIVRQCELEYQWARWPEGPPADFERTLCAAQLYWYFRWLGDQRTWTRHEKVLYLFEQLRSAGERLELLGTYKQ